MFNVLFIRKLMGIHMFSFIKGYMAHQLNNWKQHKNQTGTTTQQTAAAQYTTWEESEIIIKGHL